MVIEKTVKFLKESIKLEKFSFLLVGLAFPHKKECFQKFGSELLLMDEQEMI